MPDLDPVVPVQNMGTEHVGTWEQWRFSAGEVLGPHGVNTWVWLNRCKMDCVIMFRNPSNGMVGFIYGEEIDQPLVFKHMDDAIAFAEGRPMLHAWPYQIVELGEL